MIEASLNVWILLVAPEYGRVWRHSVVLAGSARAPGQLARKLLLPMSAVFLKVLSFAVDFESSSFYCPHPTSYEKLLVGFYVATAALIFPSTSAVANSNTTIKACAAEVQFLLPLPISLHIEPLSAGYMSLLLQAGERSQYCATARWSTYLAPVY